MALVLVLVLVLAMVDKCALLLGRAGFAGDGGCVARQRGWGAGKRGTCTARQRDLRLACTAYPALQPAASIADCVCRKETVPRVQLHPNETPLPFFPSWTRPSGRLGCGAKQNEHHVPTLCRVSSAGQAYPVQPPPAEHDSRMCLNVLLAIAMSKRAMHQRFSTSNELLYTVLNASPGPGWAGRNRPQPRPRPRRPAHPCLSWQSPSPPRHA